MRYTWRALFLLIFIFVVATYYTWTVLEDTLSIHVPASVELPSDRGMTYEKVSLKTEDGMNIAGWLMLPEKPMVGAVILHGFETENGGKSETFVLNTAEALYGANVAILAIDMRSFGESDGNKVTLGIKEWMDASTAHDYLSARRELKGKPVGFIGDSMGAVVAIATASRTGKGDFVVASVPFENYKTVFKYWVKNEGYPRILAPLVSLVALKTLGLDYYKYDPDKLIGNLDVPLLLIGAEEDEEVGTDIARLFSLAKMPKELWRPDGSDHVLVDKMRLEYEKVVIDFVSKLF